MAIDQTKQIKLEKLLLNIVTIKRLMNKFCIVDVEQLELPLAQTMIQVAKIIQKNDHFNLKYLAYYHFIKLFLLLIKSLIKFKEQKLLELMA